MRVFRPGNAIPFGAILLVFCTLQALLLPLQSSAMASGEFSFERYESMLSVDSDSALPPAPDIPDLVDSLMSGVVGRTDVHFINFTANGGFLAPGGAIVVSFPQSFNVAGVDTGVYSDDDPDNIDFTITEFSTGTRSIRFSLDTLGTAPIADSRVSLRIDSVASPAIAGGYQVVVSAFDSLNNLLAGPTLSDVFTVEADTLANLSIFPKGVLDVDAGNTAKFTFVGTDEYDNELDGLSATWSVVPFGGVTAGTVSDEGVFLGTTAGTSRVKCEVGSLVDISGQIYVYAGPVDHYDVSGVPLSVVAGQAFPDSILVEARDVYGNLVTENESDIWFESTDPDAMIEPNADNPYPMTALADTGDVIFPGSSFVFKTVGLQEIYLTDGTNQSSMFRVMVAAGSVANFDLSVATSVVAGVPFTLSVSNIEDDAGNPLTQYVGVELVTDGESPGGDLPAISGFLAEGGSGSAQQTLVRSGTARIRVTVGALQTLTPPIVVANAEAESFAFGLSSPQIVTLPFDGPNMIEVFDRFGNVAVDFDASLDTVTIEPDGSGTVVPSILNTDSAFVGGVCDLTRYDFAYTGTERYASFTATSDSGVTGTSNIVSIHSTVVDRLSVSPDELQAKDTLTALVTIVNYGSSRVTIDNVSLISDQGEIAPYYVSPASPFSIAGDSTLTDTIKAEIPVSFFAGWARLKAAVQGTYEDLPISRETDYLDSVRIVDFESLAYTERSLSPLTVTRGEPYSFTCNVSQSGVDYISLDTTSYLMIVSPADDTLISKLKSPTYIPATGQPATLFFDQATIPLHFGSGSAEATLELFGSHGILNYRDTIVIPDAVTVQEQSAVTFVDNEFAPDSAYRGTSIAPSLTVNNSGEASLVLDVGRSYLQLISGADELRFNLAESSVILGPGNTVLEFDARLLPSLFPLEPNSMTLQLYGEENGFNREVSIALGENLIEVLRQATVQLVETYTSAPNVPRVNTGQTFDLIVKVMNQGEEDLSDIEIVLESDGTSTFTGTVSIQSLSVAETDSVVVPVTASADPNSAELFTADISSAVGSETDLDAIVMSPLDNSVAVNIQMPAVMSLSASIDSPPSAVGGTVTAGQSFHVSAQMSNSGQSRVGYGGIAIVAESAGFEVDQDTVVTVRTGDVTGWDLEAPDEVGDYDITVLLYDIPDDSNTTEPAMVETGSIMIPVSVEAEQISLEVAYTFGANELASPGEPFDALNLSITAESDNPGAKARLDSLTIKVRDRTGAAIPASDAMLSATASTFGSEFAGVFKADRVVFDFSNSLVIEAGQSALELVVSLTVLQGYDGTNLFVAIEPTSLAATDISYGIEGGSVPVTDRRGESISGSAGFGVVASDFEMGFVNYPNPFSAGEESTRLVYFVPDNSDVTLDIFTLTGEIVYTEHILSGQAGAAPGQQNVIFWDGRNARGDVVLNGVYIAVLKLSSGGEATRKIAVVK